MLDNLWNISAIDGLIIEDPDNLKNIYPQKIIIPVNAQKFKELLEFLYHVKALQFKLNNA